MQTFHITKVLTILTFILTSYTCLSKEVKVVAPVAFYNLENLFDTLNDPDINDEDFLPTGSYNYNTKIYTSKLHNLATVISKLGTEINPDGFALLGVSEVENKEVLKDLVAQPELKDRGLRIVHFNSHDYRGIDVALLYNPKYFRVLSAKPYYMYIDGKEYITRSVLWVRGKLLDEEIDILVNHWPSRRGGESATAYLREAAAAIDRSVMDSVLGIDSTANFIVMGDLNDDPTNNSVVGVLGAKPEIEEVKSAKDLYNPYYNLYKAGMGSSAYRDAWSLFDQIILGKGFLYKNNKNKWTYKGAEIYKEDFMVQRFGRYKGYPLRSFSYGKWLDGYSDHFPSVIYLAKSVKQD